MADRTAHVTWSGSLMEGAGTITQRRKRRLRAARRHLGRRAQRSRTGSTSPEELIAAAHAACFSMALSHGLAQGGTPPDKLDVDATVTFVPGTGITKIALDGPRRPCPVSTRRVPSRRPRARRPTARSRKALASVPEITPEREPSPNRLATLRRWRSSASSTSWTAPTRRRRSACPIPRSTTTTARRRTPAGG